MLRKMPLWPVTPAPRTSRGESCQNPPCILPGTPILRPSIHHPVFTSVLHRGRPDGLCNSLRKSIFCRLCTLSFLRRRRSRSTGHLLSSQNQMSLIFALSLVQRLRPQSAVHNVADRTAVPRRTRIFPERSGNSRARTICRPSPANPSPRRKNSTPPGFLCAPVRDIQRIPAQSGFSPSPVCSSMAVFNASCGQATYGSRRDDLRSNSTFDDS